MSETILLRMDTWNKIRGDFSEEEKAKLNAAICGETICPRGCTLDVEKLGEPLASKIKAKKAEKNVPRGGKAK